MIALVALIWQSIITRKQMRLNFFADYTKRYQEIILNFPENINTSEFNFDLIKEDNKDLYTKTMRYMRTYFDLCSEEYFLNKDGKINKKVWAEWESGIKYTFSKKAFRDAWIIVNLDSKFYPDFVKWVNGFLLTLPKPFYISLKNVKAIVLGCDPTAFDKNNNPLKFDYVFDLGKDNNPYFAGILSNLEKIGLNMENIYVQNLITDYLDKETSKNKVWTKIAEDFILDRKKELDEVDPNGQIPVMLTSEILYKVLLNKNQPKYKAKQFYNLEVPVPIPAAINRLERPLIPLYRHPAYILNQHEGYMEHIKKTINSI